MRSTLRLALVLLIAGVGTYFASQAASASADVAGPQSCSVVLQPNTVAEITVDPAPAVGVHQIYRQGQPIETDAVSWQGLAHHQDLNVPNERAVHYSVFTGDGSPRIYCGSIAPVLKTCSVSVTAGNPVVGWSSNTADHIWRNGKLVQSPYGGAEANVGLVFDYRYVDDAAGAIGQLGHYSVQWADGSRTYCGNVTVPGRALSCNLAVHYEGRPYVRIQADGFANATAPGRALLFRNGHQISWTAFYDETNGLLDDGYWANEINHYSLSWRNDQGERTQRVYCGSIVPPEPV